MVKWKKVDADQLDTDLTSVADAIREKAGTTEELAFPGGFVSALDGLVDNETYFAQVFNGEIAELKNSKITKLTSDLCRNNQNLTVVDLPNVTSIGSSNFNNCKALSQVNFPKLKTMGASNFEVAAFEEIILPELETITGWGYNFCGCRVERIYLPKLKNLTLAEFSGCASLVTVVLGAETVCEMPNVNVFNQTPVQKGTGFVYVPRALVDSYKSATNWSTYASQIRAIEDYPEVLEGWE